MRAIFFFRLAILEKMKSRCAGGYRMTRGVYCLAKHHLYFPPTFSFPSFSLAVTGLLFIQMTTVLVLGAEEVDRRLWLSFPHYFVGQNMSCLDFSVFFFSLLLHFSDVLRRFEVCDDVIVK
jgi:hypothetical protein